MAYLYLLSQMIRKFFICLAHLDAVLVLLLCWCCNFSVKMLNRVYSEMLMAELFLQIQTETLGHDQPTHVITNRTKSK